ncbi:acyltransferase [Aidingimonas halophila]|uniref:1-acyl-sn-glycerol-3-phosphate acyltransferase n=1 Tax=Aidingimonas halophila TaxID=574349 RepID=A0A1H3BVL6_9GAMM|nr:acyltransferase [Aidingimonas halophila]GHC27208.1 acyltransferase [Aidingimonas halophila]SDX45765.1 1-acyl-sn-glycerol-3-phosphate acyltransferase [Aidingimonas halophila]
MSTLKGFVSVCLLCLSTLIWTPPLLILTLIKLFMPTRQLQLRVLGGLNRIALNWIGTNLWWMRRWLKPQLSSVLPETLSRDGWWLVIANHCCWTDIFVLQMALHRRIPMPRFFLKRELFWVPIVGLAWWALEYPFLRRYRREQVQQTPQLAERDRRETERMCRRAQDMPIAIYNFVEGTRFTPAKHTAQQSPYRHLLRPKAGGTAQVIRLMGHRLSGILDATLIYAHPAPSFWRFLCGREGPIQLEIHHLNVPAWMTAGDYHQDPDYKERFQTWLNALWQDKDRRIDTSS